MTARLGRAVSFGLFFHCGLQGEGFEKVFMQERLQPRLREFCGRG